VKGVIGIVLIAAALEFPGLGTWLAGKYGTSLLINVGASLLLNVAASFFIKAPRAAPLAGIGINYAGTLEARRIIYGQLKMGGMNALPPLTSGPCHDLADIALALGS
jgi:hypothetical protein